MDTDPMRRRTCGRCHQLIEQQRNVAAGEGGTWRFVEHDRVVRLGAPSVQCEGSNVNEYYSRKPPRVIRPTDAPRPDGHHSVRERS